jgi:hypothetical protein
MYRTPEGERILLGAERQLFEASLAMMVDLLGDDDCDFGVRLFDELQRGQKLYSLYRVARALLRPDEPAPQHTAFAEASIASVYQHLFEQIVQEINDRELAARPQSWRQLAIEAARASRNIETWPKETSENTEQWEALIESLADNVLQDRDFELIAHLDADPEVSRAVKGYMGVSETYYSAVPDDPPDDQLNLYVDALKGLTPSGRGTYLQNDDDRESPDSEWF